MDDLISRSALLDSLIYCEGIGRKSLEAVIKSIKEQPTAHDVDKVVEKLEVFKKKVAKQEYCIIKNNKKECTGRYCFNCVLDGVIEIVRKGGVDERN